MKLIALLSLIIQVFLTNCLLARSLPENIQGIIFQPAGIMHHTGASVSPEKLNSLRPTIDATTHRLHDAGIHPFAWQKEMPAGVTLLFPVSGPLDLIQRTADSFAKQGARPCWIWVDAAKGGRIDVKVYLFSSGEGYLHLFQGDQQIGYMPCRSGLRAKQPHEGSWVIKGKCSEREPEGLSDSEPIPGELGRTSNKHKSWMPWAVELESTAQPNHKDNTGFFLHGGSLNDPSDGCIRVSRPGAKVIRSLVNKGSSVEIAHIN